MVNKMISDTSYIVKLYKSISQKNHSVYTAEAGCRPAGDHQRTPYWYLSVTERKEPGSGNKLTGRSGTVNVTGGKRHEEGTYGAGNDS